MGFPAHRALQVRIQKSPSAAAILGHYSYEPDSFRQRFPSRRFADTRLPRNLNASLYSKQSAAEFATSNTSVPPCEQQPPASHPSESQSEQSLQCGLRNIGNDCYANSALQVLYWMQQKSTIFSCSATTSIHKSVQKLLQRMRTSSVASADSVLAAVRQQHMHRFTAGQQHCLLEFLESLLPHVSLAPGSLTEFSAVRTCRRCNSSSESLPMGSVSQHILCISLCQYCSSPLTIHGLLNAHLRPRAARCEQPGCSGRCEEQITATDGRFSIVYFSRTASDSLRDGQKVSTAIRHSASASATSSLGHPVIVVSHHGHSATGGHYTASVWHNGAWWLMDDSRVTLTRSPFSKHPADVILVALQAD
jgi:hypothetical protein